MPFNSRKTHTSVGPHIHLHTHTPYRLSPVQGPRNLILQGKGRAFLAVPSWGSCSRSYEESSWTLPMPLGMLSPQSLLVSAILPSLPSMDKLSHFSGPKFPQLLKGRKKNSYSTREFVKHSEIHSSTPGSTSFQALDLQYPVAKRLKEIRLGILGCPV